MLDRLVHMALREEELFRTRVMYYDSLAPSEARFTPPCGTASGQNTRRATAGGKKTPGVTAVGGNPLGGKKPGRKSGKRRRGESSESEVPTTSSDSSSSASSSAGEATGSGDTDTGEDEDDSRVIGQLTLSDDSTLADVVQLVLSHSEVRDSVRHDALVDGGARPDERSRPCAEQPRALAAHNPLPRDGARIQRDPREHPAMVRRTSDEQLFAHREGREQARGLSMTPRRRALEDAADVFHSEALAGSACICNSLTTDQVAKDECVRRLVRMMGRRLYGKSPDDCTYRNPPPQMFQIVDEDEVVAQYHRFQSMVAEMAHGGAGRLRGLRLRPVPEPPAPCSSDSQPAAASSGVASASATVTVPLNGLAVPKDCRMAERVRVQSCIHMLRHGDFSASKSLVGVCLQITRPASHGAQFGVVTAVDVGLADEDVYRKVMAMPLHLITNRGIWHIVRLYHRMFMRSMCVETMCESVASMLRYFERKNSVGRDASLKTIVVGARLRCAGLRGDLSDAAFIWRALCHLFRTRDPERMHFMRRDARRGGIGRMLLDDKYAYGPSCAISQARARAFGAGNKDVAARQEWINSAGLPALCKALDKDRLKSTRAAAGMDDYTSQSFSPEALASLLGACAHGECGTVTVCEAGVRRGVWEAPRTGAVATGP